MNRWLGIRVRVAQWLLRGTNLQLCRESQLRETRRELWSLQGYVHSSGALCNPRRIMAQKKITRRLEKVERLAREIVVR